MGAAPGMLIIGGGLAAAGVGALAVGAVGHAAGAFCCFGASGHGRFCASPRTANKAAAQNTSAASGRDIFPSMVSVPSVGVGIRKPCKSGDKGANLDATAALAMFVPRDGRNRRGSPQPGPGRMTRYDFRTPRLYVEQALSPAAQVGLTLSQQHYLKDVLRLKPGAAVLAFNGREGEWRGVLEGGEKRGMALRIEAQTRPQTEPCDLHYLFAPLKRARLEYVVQKAVEMGVARLQPVLTRHTQAERVNSARMRANAVEAAEQCGILDLPEVAEPQPLARVLAALEPARLLLFCDEDAPITDPLAALAAAAGGQGLEDAGERGGRAKPRLPLAVLVGPEGGFHPDERALLLKRETVVRLALGPRILRADTAAVAALALVQAVLGDWG